ncbi:unnamed protein product [Rotaria magnacalcarata]|uniref:Uncharacterized protein n=1 Tax=Rotaria magnacalcarata TaxID=392030 RepID=A0A819RTR5_9BILA|nr:unnamed protein product [Rotaria magnacalcarata]
MKYKAQKEVETASVNTRSTSSKQHVLPPVINKQKQLLSGIVKRKSSTNESLKRPLEDENDEDDQQQAKLSRSARLPCLLVPGGRLPGIGPAEGFSDSSESSDEDSLARYSNNASIQSSLAQRKGLAKQLQDITAASSGGEVLAELCDIIRVSSDHTNTLQPGEMANSWLPKTILYDDCYHVVKHIIDYFPKNFRQTPASTFLYHSSFAIDAYHYRNHTDKWCQQYLNPNENEVVKRFNTQSAEQSNSWIKRFSKQFSRFDDEHCVFFSP